MITLLFPLIIAQTSFEFLQDYFNRNNQWVDLTRKDTVAISKQIITSLEISLGYDDPDLKNLATAITFLTDSMNQPTLGTDIQAYTNFIFTYLPLVNEHLIHFNNFLEYLRPPMARKAVFQNLGHLGYNLNKYLFFLVNYRMKRFRETLVITNSQLKFSEKHMLNMTYNNIRKSIHELTIMERKRLIIFF